MLSATTLGELFSRLPLYVLLSVRGTYSTPTMVDYIIELFYV